MKFLAIAFCVAILGSANAVPLKASHSSALDLFDLLENIIEDEGHALLTKIVDLVHKVEEAAISLKSLVPNVYKKVHQEADDILSDLQGISKEIKELLETKTSNVLYGFDFLGGLQELTGNTKLSTVISLIRLADKTHKVVEDCKGFVPNLTKELNKIQGKLENHATVLTKHVLAELGLDKVFLQSARQVLDDLIDAAKKEGHRLMLTILSNMDQTIDLIKTHFPDTYEKVQNKIKDLREETEEIIEEIQKHVYNVIGYGLLDVAGDLTSGTSLGTALKVMSLVDKFNKVVQDVKNFEPNAEIVLQHSVNKVESSAENFFKHAVEILLKDL